MFSSLEGTGVADPDLALELAELELAAVDPLDLEPDLDLERDLDLNDKESILIKESFLQNVFTEVS